MRSGSEPVDSGLVSDAISVVRQMEELKSPVVDEGSNHKEAVMRTFNEVEGHEEQIKARQEGRQFQLPRISRQEDVEGRTVWHGNTDVLLPTSCVPCRATV